MDLEIQSINDDIFRVIGNSIKLFINELNNMGGKYEDGCYIFENSSRDRVNRFIEGIQMYISPPSYRHDILSDCVTDTKTEGLSDSSSDEVLKGSNDVMTGEVSDGLYQTVTYKVQRPNKDMKIKLKYGEYKYDYNIVRIKENKGIVDEVLMQNEQEVGSESVSKLVICNGKWQVLGFTELHEIEFVTE